MFKKTFLLTALIVTIAIVGTAFAQSSPPANGSYSAGWGMNPTSWTSYTGTWSSGFALYDPNAPALAGAGWVVGWNPTTYITYAPITLELWIEMYSLQTYQYTSYKWHRLGNAAETITFTIEGTLRSNNGQWVSLMQGTEDLTLLHFKEDIFGRTGAPYGYDIPITWQGRYGNGLVYGVNVLQGWTALTPDAEGDLNLGPIPSCDHWFQFQGEFDLAYHIEDGYYSLTMEGCPAPEM